MDLLNENQYQNQSSPGKKIVLVLIILSVILVIAIIALMVVIKSKEQVKNAIYINGEKIEITDDFIVRDAATGMDYISIKDLATLLGYKYNNNEYKQDGLDSTKCFVRNDKLISSFDLTTKTMYKYDENTNLDYQYYTLKNELKTFNNKLYISLNDVNIALNVQCGKDNKNNIVINSVEYLVKEYQEKLTELGYTIAEDQNNRKAIAYGWIIVSKDNLYSILNTNFEEIISSRYSSIYFDECNNSYIVSNTNGKYGIISTDGVVRMQFIFDGLEILNYENMLYKVKNREKYGIARRDGSILVNIEYDDIGYPADNEKQIEYTLIVDKIEETPEKTIVVKKDNKYGLVTLSTGEVCLPCNQLDKLYSVIELGKIVYKVEVDKQVLNLSDYLRILMTQTLNV